MRIFYNLSIGGWGIIRGRLLFEDGVLFFKICKNGALFEVGYYSRLGSYSSKYVKSNYQLQVEREGLDKDYNYFKFHGVAQMCPGVAQMCPRMAQMCLGVAQM